MKHNGEKKMHTKFLTENVKKTKTLRRLWVDGRDNVIRILIRQDKWCIVAHPAMNCRFSQTGRNFLPSRLRIIALHGWLLAY
jgi:hypothetical protein